MHRTATLWERRFTSYFEVDLSKEEEYFLQNTFKCLLLNPLLFLQREQDVLFMADITIYGPSGQELLVTVSFLFLKDVRNVC